MTTADHIARYRDVRRQPDLFAEVFNDEPQEMDAECGLWCAEAA